MNKLLLGFFILTISAASYGQETKRVKKDEGNVGHLEIYHVLKSDKNIKHGPYEKFLKIFLPRNQIRVLLEKGQYENNKKTGVWTFYRNEETMTAQGAYENDLQTGNWEYYKDGVVTLPSFRILEENVGRQSLTPTKQILPSGYLGFITGKR